MACQELKICVIFFKIPNYKSQINSNIKIPMTQTNWNLVLVIYLLFGAWNLEFWRIIMPAYEYKCMKCREQFEVTQRITDAPLTDCNICGGELKRLITNTSFVLKGSGWYVTDYPSPERKEAMKAKKSVSTKDTHSEKNTDSKKEEAVKAK
jgi:putative FmdB family regulatory protein